MRGCVELTVASPGRGLEGGGGENESIQLFYNRFSDFSKSEVKSVEGTIINV